MAWDDIFFGGGVSKSPRNKKIDEILKKGKARPDWRRYYNPNYGGQGGAHPGMWGPPPQQQGEALDLSMLPRQYTDNQVRQMILGMTGLAGKGTQSARTAYQLARKKKLIEMLRNKFRQQPRGGNVDKLRDARRKLEQLFK